MVELFENSLKLIERNIFSFLIMLIIFLFAYLVLYEIALLFGLINALLFSLVYGIFSAVEFLIFAIYIASLGNVANLIIENKTADYISSIKKGIDIVRSRSSITLIILILGFIAGFLSITFDGVPGLYGLGAGIGSIILGIFYFVVTGISLSGYLTNDNKNFLAVFDKINKVSPNAGITLYIIALLPIVPILGALQMLVLGLAVVLIVSYEKSKAMVVHHKHTK
ncbi:MAG: hypothetical protein ACP5M9_00235 [Candidatus Micrarchaeia archaeon]